MRIGLAIASLSIIFVLIEGLLAYASGMLTPNQMLKKHPNHPKGLPFIAHGGMWGDLFVITPILGFIVGMYGEEWSRAQVTAMTGVGITLSIIMHRIYVMTPIPDTLAWKEGISKAGWVHVFYMGSAFAIIGLLYFCTKNVPPFLLVLLSLLLTAHIGVGNHIVLGWLNESYRWPWCPELIRKPDPWVTTGATCFLLAFMTAWGSTTAIGLAVVGIGFLTGILLYLRFTNTFEPEIAPETQ